MTPGLGRKLFEDCATSRFWPRSFGGMEYAAARISHGFVAPCKLRACTGVWRNVKALILLHEILSKIV
jgi:hypothetical protein